MTSLEELKQHQPAELNMAQAAVTTTSAARGTLVLPYWWALIPVKRRRKRHINSGLSPEAHGRSNLAKTPT